MHIIIIIIIIVIIIIIIIIIVIIIIIIILLLLLLLFSLTPQFQVIKVRHVMKSVASINGVKIAMKIVAV